MEKLAAHPSLLHFVDISDVAITHSGDSVVQILHGKVFSAPCDIFFLVDGVEDWFEFFLA